MNHINQKGANVPWLNTNGTVRKYPTKQEIFQYLQRVRRDEWNDSLSPDDKVKINLLKAWYFNPLKGKRNEIFKMGHDNEPLLARNLYNGNQKDTDQFQPPVRITSLKEAGLLQASDFPALAASLDGIGVLKDDTGHDLFSLEMKTRVNYNTINREHAHSRELGCYIRVKLTNPISNAQIETLSKSIPCKPHRVQLLHHMAVSRSTRGMIVYGEPEGVIIRAVLVVVDQSFSKLWLESLSGKLKDLLPWLHVKDEPDENFISLIEPHIGKKGLKQIPDLNTFSSAYKLTRCLLKHKLQIAFAYSIKPSIILFYNSLMGGEET
eukprot:Pgem_evm2s18268